MKWYDIRFWKWATITLVVGLALVSVLGCSTPRAVTSQTFITDKQSEKKFDSLFTTRLSYAFEQWQHIQKRETEKATKDSSYVKDSTATRYDAQGKRLVKIVSITRVTFCLKRNIENYSIPSVCIKHTKIALHITEEDAIPYQRLVPRSSIR